MYLTADTEGLVQGEWGVVTYLSLTCCICMQVKVMAHECGRAVQGCLEWR